ncbi:MAG: winged helix DNA-binding protein [Bacteroidetes bacterium]|nr:winged helix DNA-binding protein [Bacteroidota bacterium]
MKELETLSKACFDINYKIRQIKYVISRDAGLSTSEYEVLSYLRQVNDRRAIKDVSQYLLLCSQAVTKIAKRLLQLEYISMEKSAADRRVTFLTLTSKGQALAEEEDRQKAAIFQEITQYAKPAQMEAMQHVFGEMIERWGELV